MGIKSDFITLPDGVRIESKRLAGGPKTPVLCLHGLTRNSADFDDLLPRLAATGRDAVAITFRGRGASDRDPHYLNYHPAQYRDDAFFAIKSMDLGRPVLLGTSLGGLVTMLAAEKDAAALAGAILNDAGPALAPEGLARIGRYIAANREPIQEIDEAAARVRAINEVAFPGKDDDFWRAFARRVFRQNADGTWSLDYDPNIARAFGEVGPAPDLWPGFKAMAAIPTLMIRGAISDLITPAIVASMREAHPDFDYAEVPNVGHAPLLTETEAWTAIETFLSKID